MSIVNQDILTSLYKELTTSIVLRVLIALVLIIIFQKLWSRRKLYALSLKLPGPLAFPFLGNGIDLQVFSNFRNSVNSLYKLKKIHGEIYRMWLGTELSIVITEAKDAECILLSKETASKGPKYNVVSTAIGEGLLTASGPKWKKHRHIINPSFSGLSCKSYQGIHDKHGKYMADNLIKLCGTGLVDVAIHSLRCTGDIIAEGLFGIETEFFKCDKDTYLLKIPIIAELVYERICKIWLINETIYELSKSGKKMKKSLDEYQSFYNVKMREKIDTYLKNSKNVLDEMDHDKINNKLTRNTFDLMMSEIMAGNFTKQEAVDEFDNIFGPGTDTAYTHLSFFILMMGMHKRCQDLVWQEIKEVYSDDLEALVTSEAISKMKYLDMCWKEVTRLFPTGPVQMRSLEKDFYMKHRDLVIPKGASFLISNFVLHRNPKYWEDPDLYIPERFNAENSKNRPHFAYLPFSAGLRNCIGQTFGYDMLKTASIHLIRKMEFHSDIKMKDLRVHADISTRSVVGYNVQISKRII